MTNTADFRRANKQPGYRHLPMPEYVQRAHEFARHGEQCATKLTEAQAVEIRRRRKLAQHYLAEARTLSNTSLAEKCEMTHKAVSRIINGKRWKTGSGKSRYAGMTYELALLLRDAGKERDRLKSLAAEHSTRKIAEEYGVSESLVGLIGTGDRWVMLGLRGEA